MVSSGTGTVCPVRPNLTRSAPRWVRSGFGQAELVVRPWLSEWSLRCRASRPAWDCSTKSLPAISYAQASERRRSVLRRTRWPFCVDIDSVLPVESRLCLSKCGQDAQGRCQLNSVIGAQWMLAYQLTSRFDQHAVDLNYLVLVIQVETEASYRRGCVGRRKGSLALAARKSTENLDPRDARVAPQTSVE